MKWQQIPNQCILELQSLREDKSQIWRGQTQIMEPNEDHKNKFLTTS